MSEAPKPRHARAVAVLGSRATLAVTRVTLGLGMVALVLSERHTGPSYTSAWGIAGWVGYAVVVLSLPSVVYDIYLRYLRSRRTARSTGARQAAAECVNHPPSPCLQNQGRATEPCPNQINALSLFAASHRCETDGSHPCETAASHLYETARTGRAALARAPG